MKIFKIILIFSLLPYFSMGQDINVKSFKLLDNDLDALVNYPEKDQNGDLAALIKVVTSETGFKFDVGSLGIVKVVQKTGEIWLYIPQKARRLTISHAQLGVLRNFIFEIPIELAKVYEMQLTTKRVEIVVKENEIKAQWLVIQSQPSGANVYIDEKLVGQTPLQRKFKEGKYNYRVEIPKYKAAEGNIDLFDEKIELQIDLNANYGSVYVNSYPESGMDIFLNQENTGKKTPAEIKGILEGQHTIKVMNKWYHPQVKSFDIMAGEKINLDFQMQAAYSLLKITSSPPSDIFIDNEKVASGTFEGRFLSGLYSIEIKNEIYQTEKTFWQAEENKEELLHFDLKPKTGSVDIITTPIGAQVFINDKDFGKSPTTINDLLIGAYDLTLTYPNFKQENLKINISEGKTLRVNRNLLKDGIFEVDNLKAVRIGNQIWMAENLNTKAFQNGDNIQEASSKQAWIKAGKENVAAWSAYNNSSNNEEKLGKLYNWYAITDDRKLCPSGWQIPTDKDWEQLINYLGGNNIAGEKMKAKTTWFQGGNGNDKSYFGGMPGGLRGKNGSFFNVAKIGAWWSVSKNENGEVWTRGLSHQHKSISRQAVDKEAGFSVRCIKMD